jgi:hypothetical protein
MNIGSLTTIGRRELAQRVTGGIEITLYWNVYDNSTTIEVHHHATGETISFPVPAHRALDAFHHPFAHLATQKAA